VTKNSIIKNGGDIIHRKDLYKKGYKSIKKFKSKIQAKKLAIKMKMNGDIKSYRIDQCPYGGWEIYGKK